MVSATRELLADRYHLEERIATGGMGVVWRARDHRLGRDVAIKLIRPEYADDPTFRQRLQLEARAIAAINSPHVVRIHDVCEEADPAGGYRAFIVMELVEGEPLSAVLRDGPLSVERTADVMSQTASALAAAHEQQIIHRDVKPANVMVGPGGQVTVLDFGIARAADAVALTATDLILGTARYIAPEQADGRGATASSDVYSLGVVAFQCLSGEVPYDTGSDVAIALAHLRDPVPPLPAHVPEPTASLVGEMLAKSPADRPTAAAAAERFAAASGMPVVDITDAALAQTQRGSRPEPTAVMPVVMAARHRVRDRLAGRDLGETRSAALSLRLLLIPAGAVVIAILIALIASGGSSGLPPAAARSNTHAVTHHVASKVMIDPTLYVGQDWSTVQAALLALHVVPTPQFAGDGSTETVVGLSPTGRVAKGTAVTVLVSRTGPPPPHGPGPGPAHAPPGHAKKDKPPKPGDHGD